MHLVTPIVLGRTAEIYVWKDGYIIKLFRDWMTADSGSTKPGSLVRFTEPDCHSMAER